MIVLDYLTDKYKMRLESCQLFARLCESTLVEASSTLDMVKGHPGAQQTVQYLHTKMGLSHDQQYQPIPKILWNDLKSNYKGTWVLIKGATGTGAIKYDGRSYTAVASAGGEPATKTDDRGGNILDFLKGQIGNPKSYKFFTGKEQGKVKDVQRKRQELRGTSSPTEMNQEKLLTKFRPLWVKAMNAAIADVKGHVANQIKNDAFEKAKHKLEHIQRLQNGIDALEVGGDTPGFLNTAINSAVLMAASHYYPDETGEITRSRYGSGSYSSQFPEGPQKLLKDISSGDTSKIGTILAFFKRSLISG